MQPAGEAAARGLVQAEIEAGKASGADRVRPVRAPAQSLRQTRTAVRLVGPNHLGVFRLQADLDPKAYQYLAALPIGNVVCTSALPHRRAAATCPRVGLL